MRTKVIPGYYTPEKIVNLKTNNYRVEGDVAIMELTRGQETKIDLEDLERVLQHRWHAVWNATFGGYYAATAIKDGDVTRTIYLHRFIMGVENAGRSVHVDHKHHKTLDNRKGELEVCSPLENMQNRKGPYRNNTSGHRNISELKQGDRSYWQATLSVKGERRTKTFPFNDQGFDAAKTWVRAERARLRGEGDQNTVDEALALIKDQPNINSTTGIKGVTVEWSGGMNKGTPYYKAQVQWGGRQNRQNAKAYFPHTPEGLALAKRWYDAKRAEVKGLPWLELPAQVAAEKEALMKA